MANKKQYPDDGGLKEPVRDFRDGFSGFEMIRDHFGQKKQGKFDTLVYIGRFQPLHNAHINIIKQAAELANQVIVIVGSANQPRTHKNPFTFDERADLIFDALDNIKLEIPSLAIAGNIDTIYDDTAWVIRVQEIVASYTKEGDRIGIIGHTKDDETSEYLQKFKQWELIDVPHEEVLHATTIRDFYFSKEFNLKYLQGVVPETVLQFLAKFHQTEHYRDIVEEKQHIDLVWEKKKVYEYPIMAVTVDTVMEHAGHILLIKRRAIPGKGLWALPLIRLRSKALFVNCAKRR